MRIKKIKGDCTVTKISIIVPVYNSEKYIQRCICSVTSQNPSGCEIILIDDGSKRQIIGKDE